MIITINNYFLPHHLKMATLHKALEDHFKSRNLKVKKFLTSQVQAKSKPAVNITNTPSSELDSNAHDIINSLKANLQTAATATVVLPATTETYVAPVSPRKLQSPRQKTSTST